MQDAISDALSKAYDLIEADKLDEARAILEPLTTSQADNPDVWWVYAHAVSDPDSARKALQNVLRLDDSYPEAADLMKTLDAEFPPPAASTPARPAIKKLAGAMPAPPPPDLPEKGDALAVGAPRRSGNRRTMLLAVVGLILVAVIAAIVAIIAPPKPSGNTTLTPGATQVSLGTTVASAATSEVASTAEVTDYTPIQNALSAFNVQRIQIGQTGLGDTLLVSICTTAGRELRTTLPLVMDVIAHQSVLVKDQVAAVGARMVDCTTHSTLSVIAVTIQNAVAYAGGSMAEGDFQAAWKPQ